MGNTSQCTFLQNTDQQYQFLGTQNHFFYGEIKHFKNEKHDNQHFAIKTINFPSSNKLKKFKELLSFYELVYGTLHLTKALQYKTPNSTQKQKESLKQQGSSNKQNSQPIFHCNKENLVFTSVTQQMSCSQTSYVMNLNLEYLEEKNSLQSIICEKEMSLKRAVQNNKVNQNILLQLENRVKLCEYQKIDKLPHKERSIVNMFFNQIEVLRMLDYMITSLYGLKINGVFADAVRPQLFFKSNNNEDISYFLPSIVDINHLSNFKRSYQSLRKWLNEQNAKFHHNWNPKQRELISYIHPDHLQKLTEYLINQPQQNFIDFDNAFSKEELQKQNIFAIGLIMLQLCLLQPQICSKIYHVSTCKSQEKKGPQTKKEIKYSFDKENLTLKLNHSTLRKYLIQMKTKYSDQFVELVELMLFGSISNRPIIHTTSSTTNIKYEDVIQKLSFLTEDNIENLKSIYNRQTNPKSKSKITSQKNSRNPSLSRQISIAGTSNPSLSSCSSLSIFPVQSQQKILSVQLLRKNCKKLENKAEKFIVKSQLQTLNESFTRKEQRLQDLISKDEERILSQLNKLSSKNISQKPKRFNYRKVYQDSQTVKNTGKMDQSLSFQNYGYDDKPNEIYGTYKIKLPEGLSLKTESQSHDKEKRMNSSTKTKKFIIQRAKQQESLGNSVCHTIYLHKSKNTDAQEKLIATINNESFQKKNEGTIPKNQCFRQKNQLFGQIEPFCEGGSYNLSSKSELKSIIAMKSRGKGGRKEEDCQVKKEQKSPRQLKSRQLYQIYLKEYENLVSSQILKS